MLEILLAVIAAALVCLVLISWTFITNHAAAENNKDRNLNSIHHDLDRIGSIMRENQARSGVSLFDVVTECTDDCVRPEPKRRVKSFADLQEAMRFAETITDNLHRATVEVRA